MITAKQAGKNSDTIFDKHMDVLFDKINDNICKTSTSELKREYIYGISCDEKYVRDQIYKKIKRTLKKIKYKIEFDKHDSSYGTITIKW
jgi:transcription initiation factor IIE alpha subunit